MKNLANHKIAIRSREYLVQAIYQLFFNEQDIEDIIDQFKDEHKTKKVDFQLFSSSLKSIQANRAQLKDILDDLGVNDPDMDLIDKAIFYFALNEMTFGLELGITFIFSESPIFIESPHCACNSSGILILIVSFL